MELFKSNNIKSVSKKISNMHLSIQNVYHIEDDELVMVKKIYLNNKVVSLNFIKTYLRDDAYLTFKIMDDICDFTISEINDIIATYN
jgi:hypothetical protein